MKKEMSKEAFKTKLTPSEAFFATVDEKVLLETLRSGASAVPGDSKEKMLIVGKSLIEFKPHDSVEAMLYVQANALFAQGMKYLERAENQELVCPAEHYMRFALKLLRLHNETIEAIAKRRGGFEQKITVQHVQVNEGGKAAFLSNS